MESFINRMRIDRNKKQGWLAWAVLSILPVLLVSYLCCNYARAELLLGLFLVEWIIVLVVWRLLCPWLGRRGVVFAAVMFLFSFCVSAIVVRESIATYGAVWDWSDDIEYLNQAANVVDSLHQSGWDLPGTWIEFVSIERVPWTLAGWPFLIGLVSSFVTSAAPLELLHAVALSLNATFLTLVLALIYYILQQPARQYPRMVFWCFILLIGDPIIYAGMCRKESLLQLLLMLAFALCWNLPRRKRLLWGIAFGLSMFGIATTRVVYIPLILAVLYWKVLERIRIGPLLRVVLGIIIIALSMNFLLHYEIRNDEAVKFMQETLEAEPGLALSIYNIPLVGPVLYYAISPTPPLPWKMLAIELLVTKLIRSVGSIAWFLATCYVLFGIARNRKLLKGGLFFVAAFMFVGLFTAAVLYANDPRYKQPTNFYLLLMLFLTWYDSRKGREAMGVSEGQVEL